MLIKLMCVLFGVCGSAADTAMNAPSPTPPPASQPLPAEVLPPEARGDMSVVAAMSPAPPPAAPAPQLTLSPTVPPPVPTPANPGTLAAILPSHEPVNSPPENPPPGLPAWRRFAIATPPADGKPALSIVIDDMGLNGAQTARAVALPGPITLSWLPYAPHVTQQAANGEAHGHETMVHMPMEALGHSNPGPDSLRTWLPPQANLGFLRDALDLMPKAVALNQHEGSVASLSVTLMDGVAAELKLRGLAFVDSLTIPHSVALRRAQVVGVPSVARDVFIDNDPSPAAIRARLIEAEAIARHYGQAIAIGHPRPTTLEVLEAYVPDAAARGIVLWPISATIAARNRSGQSAVATH